MRETMGGVTAPAWLCDPRSVTDEELPWLELPEEQLFVLVVAAVEGAGYSSQVADGLAAWLLRKKRGLPHGRSAPAKSSYRKILAELGPPPKGRSRLRMLGNAGYASMRALGAAGAASSAALAAAGHPAALVALPLYVTMNGAEGGVPAFDQELLAA